MQTSAKHKFIEQEIAPHVDAGDWKSPGEGEEQYSVDQVIAAYLTGLKTGEEKADRAIQKQYSENLTNIGKDTQKIIDKLHEKGFSPISAILKIVTIGEFEVLVILPEEELLREKISEVYSAIGTLIERQSSDAYTFDIVLAGSNDSFNRKKVSSDGFKLYHKSLVSLAQ